MSHTAKILLLGSGELGREFVISAKRLGAYVVACDAYDDAPAMQLADAREVFSMLDGEKLREAAEKHRPDYIVPEIEAIRTSVLAELEDEGFTIVPSARAAQLTMNRDAIRDLAAHELGLVTSKYHYAKNLEEVKAAAQHTGFPCVIKPVMSSSGKGQSTVRDEAGLEAAWDYAHANMRGDRQRVIVEQFVDFDYEITLLTVRHRDGVTFCPPIGHRQERGDYQESWQPTPMTDAAIAKANGIKNPNTIKPGQKLKITKGTTGKPTKAKPAAIASSTLREINRPRIRRNRWKHIVVHHSADSNNSIRGMEHYHRRDRRMENGLAYHFVIGNGVNTTDGKIYVCDRWKRQIQGGHIGSAALNEIAIGICLVGNFEKTLPTAKQKSSLKALVSRLRSRTGIPYNRIYTHRQFHHHKELKSTICPGRRFSLRSILST